MTTFKDYISELNEGRYDMKKASPQLLKFAEKLKKEYNLDDIEYHTYTNKFTLKITKHADDYFDLL
jgi:hypothetical protein